MSGTRTILVVDDNEINLEIMRAVLSDEYHLLLARSGEDALELIAREHPDLVLLDVMMPGIDGYETCRRIRTTQALRNTKVILVSAKEYTSDRLQGYDAGADDYLVKPFDKDELLAKVRVFLRLKAAEEVDDLKTNVLSLLDHEFCTPLTGIIPAGEMLSSDREMSHEDRRKWGRLVLESGRRLLTMAQRGNLLCLLREGARKLDCTPVVLERKCNEIAQKLAPTFQGAIKCTARVDDSFSIKADEKLIDTGLRCMLEAAIHYSEPCGALDIQVVPAVGGASVSVCVEHANMTDRQLDRLFEPMNTAMHDHGGSFADGGEIMGADIALSLARAISRAHGGNMVAYREGRNGIMLNATLANDPAVGLRGSVAAVANSQVEPAN